MVRKRYSDEDCLRILRQVEPDLAAGADVLPKRVERLGLVTQPFICGARSSRHWFEGHAEQVKYRFMTEHRQDYLVTLMCRVLKVSRSGALIAGSTMLSRRYRRTVFLDNPVRREISRIGIPSRKCQRQD